MQQIARYNQNEVKEIPILIDWKQRRKDKRVEEYWKQKEAKRPLNLYEQYQKEWNFIEIEYSERPSNNNLDLVNPGFAFHTKFAKYIKFKEYKKEKVMTTKDNFEDVVLETLNDTADVVDSPKTANPEQIADAIKALTDERPSEKFVQFEEDVS